MPRVTQSAPKGIPGMQICSPVVWPLQVQTSRGKRARGVPGGLVGVLVSLKGLHGRSTPPRLQFDRRPFHCPHCCTLGDPFLLPTSTYWLEVRGGSGELRPVPSLQLRAFALVVPFVWRAPTSSLHTCTCAPMHICPYASTYMCTHAHTHTSGLSISKTQPWSHLISL